MGLGGVVYTIALMFLFVMIYSFLYGFKFFEQRLYLYLFIILFPISFHIIGEIFRFKSYSKSKLPLYVAVSTSIRLHIFTGLICTIFLIIGYFIARKRTQEKNSKSSHSVESYNLPIFCPFCREKITSQINYCPNCGKNLVNI